MKYGYLILYNFYTLAKLIILQVSPEDDFSCDELLRALVIGVKTSTRVRFPNLLFLPSLFFAALASAIFFKFLRLI